MNTQNIQLNIGDKIGFVIQAVGIDETDQTLFFPVVGITTRDGEAAYYYKFPDGTVSMNAIRQSDLASRPLQIEPQIDPQMICLSTRRSEFTEALQRGKDNSFEIYDDFDKDAFVVVNRENLSEYRVRLETHQGQTFGLCACPDFKFRKRICKHISEVLTNEFFSALAKA